MNKDSSLLRDATMTGLVETAESEDEFSNMEKGTQLFLFARANIMLHNVDRSSGENILNTLKIL